MTLSRCPEVYLQKSKGAQGFAEEGEPACWPPGERKDKVDIHLPKAFGAMCSLEGILKQSPHRLVPWGLKGLGSQHLCF